MLFCFLLAELGSSSNREQLVASCPPVSAVLRTKVVLVGLTGVACTTIIGLPDLPESDGSKMGGSSSSGAGNSSGASDAAGNGLGGAAGGADSNGGASATGNFASDGGDDVGGSPAIAGNDTGGTSGEGGDTGDAGSAGASGSAAAGPGPCDLYADANTPCVAAYSTTRRLLRAYSGPLYQVRAGSSTENTGSGGVTHDIGSTADGFADAAAQDAVCDATICTISLLYDQSGNENHLSVAKKGGTGGGTLSDKDDFESLATAEALTVAGHRVYALYTEVRQGYRLPTLGSGVPRGNNAQGIYLLADGTRSGEACCWEFGNVGADPTLLTAVNSLLFGTAYWGRGDGVGPWFLADFGNGVWAGGSLPGEPGWGRLNDQPKVNVANPSMAAARFALGFLKTNSTQYALRMADIGKESSVTTAYKGALPQMMANEGSIVLGVGSDNSNNSWGTFYEGAILAGFPSDSAEQAVLENVKAIGYSP